MPAGSWAVLEQLLVQVNILRAEMESLKAGKLASDARAARLSERVDGLEIMCADHDTQHAGGATAGGAAAAGERHHEHGAAAARRPARPAPAARTSRC